MASPDETIAILREVTEYAVKKNAFVYVEDWIGSNEPWRELTEVDLLKMVRRCIHRGVRVRADWIERAIVKSGWSAGRRAMLLEILDSLPPGDPPEIA